MSELSYLFLSLPLFIKDLFFFHVIFSLLVVLLISLLFYSFLFAVYIYIMFLMISALKCDSSLFSVNVLFHYLYRPILGRLKYPHPPLG